MWSWIKKNVTRNKVLGAIAAVVGTAGAIVAMPAVLPAVVISVATQIVIYGTTAGIIAAKIIPGNETAATNMTNAKALVRAAGNQVVDAEVPKELRKPGAR